MAKHWVKLGLIVSALALANPVRAQYMPGQGMYPPAGPYSYGPAMYGPAPPPPTFPQQPPGAFNTAPPGAPGMPGGFMGPTAFERPPSALGPFASGPGAFTITPAAFQSAPQPEGPGPAGPGQGPAEGCEQPGFFGGLFGRVPFTGPGYRGEGEDCCFRPCFSLGMEYLFLWSRPNSLAFPTLTSGSAADAVPGAIGQPGTRPILFGDFGYGPTAAFRVNAAYYFQNHPQLSLEGTGFIAEQKSNISSLNAPGGATDPVIARPFFDPEAGREAADPRAVPGLLAGSVFQSFTTRLNGGEANFRWNLCSDPNIAGKDTGFSLLYGVRYLKLDDQLLMADQTNDLPLGSGATFNFNDKFITYNRFFGGQVGARWRWCWDQILTSDLQTKIAYGRNWQTIHVTGQTVVTDGAGNLLAQDGFGLYTQPSNVGSYHHTTNSFIPEVGYNGSLRLSDNVKINIGYTFMYFTNVVRPGQQVDRTVNIQPLNFAPGFLGTNHRPAPPQFNTTDVWFQFVNLGLEFTF